MPDSFVRCSFVVLVVALTLGSPSAQAQAARPPIRLRAGDVVVLEVRDEPRLGGEFRVDEGGQVLLPLVGLITVGGRDFEDVRRDVAAAYAGELHDRDVRLTPLMRVAVLGEARQPGLFNVDPSMTLSDVLARAGGFGPEANHQRIELVRDGSVIAVLAQDELPRFAQPLNSGDQVIIGRLGWAQRNSAILLGSLSSLVVAIVTGLVLR